MDAHTLNPQAFLHYDQTLMQPQMAMPQGYIQQPVPVTTIKMEDIQGIQQPSLQTLDENNPSAPTSAPRHASTSSTSSQMSSSEQKPVKKRKSWGQVLPEPKTNLPPRKRAKTEDEKEQRRIERVKRNRLAAHNSRERKRQEVETLQDDKKLLEDRVKELEAQIQFFRQMAPHVNLDDFDPDSSDRNSQQPLTPPGTDSSAGSVTMNPRHAYNTSPETSPSLGSIDSPEDSFTGPSTPFDEPAVSDLPNPTQHSAVSVGWGQPAQPLDFESTFTQHNGLSHGDDFAHHGPTKPVDSALNLEHMFDFSAFGDDENNLFMEPTSYFEASFPPTSSSEVATAPICGNGSLFSPAGLPDHLGTKPLDLPADSGATLAVSDGSGNAAES